MFSDCKGKYKAQDLLKLLQLNKQWGYLTKKPIRLLHFGIREETFSEPMYLSLVGENADKFTMIFKPVSYFIVECRDYVLKKLQENAYIQKTFKLNIKRLNRWWYRVYFDSI